MIFFKQQVLDGFLVSGLSVRRVEWLHVVIECLLSGSGCFQAVSGDLGRFVSV